MVFLKNKKLPNQTIANVEHCGSLHAMSITAQNINDDSVAALIRRVS